MNSFVVSGKLGQDPELSVTAQKGTAVVKLSLAEDYYDFKTNEKLTEWWRVVVWGTMAERAEKILQKGMTVMVVGEIRPREYTNKEGEKKTAIELTARDFTILAWPPKKREPAYDDKDWIPENAE